MPAEATSMVFKLVMRLEKGGVRMRYGGSDQE